MKFVEISFSNIKGEIERFLKAEHNKGSILYSPASPYGQILSVLENLHQLSFLYLKNSIVQFDLSEPNSLNERIIRNAAIFAGHIPGRNISSTGNLKLTVKPGIDLEKELKGNRVTFMNRNELKNKTNSLDYSLNLGQDKITYMVNKNTQIFLPIIQGKFKTTNFTGTGNINQTFQVALAGRQDIENFNYEVLVNGSYWTIKRHLYDLKPNEEACVVRTGFNGGIDIIFGNGGFGAVPSIGATIAVTYLVSDGADGNIFRRTFNDWKFLDDAIDGFGGTVDASKIFDVAIFNDINFGANKENITFTKNILPIVSNNFVLGLPQQYAYEIKKLGVFSHVNAYEDLGIVYIVATPNIRLFKNQNSDYFAVSTRAFELDRYEKSKIDKYLRTNGNIQITKKYRIDSPTLSYYIMNVFIIRYSDSTDDSVQSQVIDAVSEYFLNFSRIDRIPKSDLVKIISNINDVHSVDVQFIAKKNEEYHREEIKRRENRKMNSTKFNVNISANKNKDIPVPNSGIELVKTNPDYKPNATLGLDPVLGDIIFEPKEIPIVRGGWYDRNGIYFSDDMMSTGLRSINIIKKGVVDSKLRNNEV
jgi:hypothetical protein